MQINMETRVYLTQRVQGIIRQKLSLSSTASEQLALSLVGDLIDDFDDVRGKLKEKLYDFDRINVLHLRVKRQLNIVYDQISNGLDACIGYPPHRDGECECYNGLYRETLKHINFIRERLF